MMSSDEDVAAIRRIRQQVEDAERAMDAPAFAELLTEDVAMLPVGIDAVHGAAEVEEFHRALYERFDEIDIRFTVEDIRVLGGLAVESGTYDTPDGGGRYLYTYERTADGTWRINRMSWD